MMEAENWFEINDVDILDTPALVIYSERVKENIRIVKEMIGATDRLRPHVKTHKTKEVIALLKSEGIEKFKCATIAECEMVALAGGSDILLAYQPVGPKLDRFISLIKAFPTCKFSCLFDDLKTISVISAKAVASDTIISVFMDLNVGMNRTGIKAGPLAIKLYEQAFLLNGVDVKGLHAYDGHIRDIDLNVRRKACDKAFSPVEELQRSLISKGYPKPVIVAGGTPTFPIHAKREEIECSPGTFIYWDQGYKTALPEQKYLLSALVITRVISIVSPNKLCLDLGHKSIASENVLEKRVHFLHNPDLKPIGQSEEHLVVETDKENAYNIGDVIYGVPYHICPTCALYERAFTIENGGVSGEWRIVARDRKIVI